MNSALSLPAKAFWACSACAGDYEDPERTAQVGESADSDEGESDDAGGDARSEFPVKEE